MKLLKIFLETMIWDTPIDVAEGMQERKQLEDNYAERKARGVTDMEKEFDEEPESAVPDLDVSGFSFTNKAKDQDGSAAK